MSHRASVHALRKHTGLKAQGIASPFKGGPATAVDAAVAAEGEGGGKGEQEELGQLMVLAAGEGEATTEEIVVGGAVAAGHDGGGEEEEEEEEVAETVQAFQLRGGLGGTRMVCALPDHRVQVCTLACVCVFTCSRISDDLGGRCQVLLLPLV